MKILASAAFMAATALALPVAAQGITTAPAAAVAAPFDLVETSIRSEGAHLVFRSQVRAEAGASRPAATGQFAGSDVYAYVWPTSLNSGAIGFAQDQGIVALAVTFHPDFDDGAKGAKNRHVWHSHWVVLAEDKACGGGLKVRDIPAGANPSCRKLGRGCRC